MISRSETIILQLETDKDEVDGLIKQFGLTMTYNDFWRVIGSGVRRYLEHDLTLEEWCTALKCGLDKVLEERKQKGA